MSSQKYKGVDLADVEHLGALAMGGVLLLVGARKSGLTSTLSKALGTLLVARGLQGYRPVLQALGATRDHQVKGLGLINEEVKREIVINGSPEELYRLWRNFENLPLFMDGLVDVTEIDDITSHWVAKGPLGTIIQWDARIIRDKENKLISWESMEGSGVDTVGSVSFEELPTGETLLVVSMAYDPPADALGIKLANLFGVDPRSTIGRDLRRFKALFEASKAAKTHETSKA